MVYSTKIEQEWTAKGLLRSNTLLLSLARFDRMKQVVARHLNHGQVRDLGEFVDRDDQPFVLVAAVIDDGSRLLITRDPKTVQVESRRYVKKEFKVVVKKASELV
jgi:arginine repressor